MTRQPKAPPKPLPIPDYLDFTAMKIPPTREILSPWLREKGLNMIHARTGVGKTHFALGVAGAVSTGGVFLGWKAPEPRRVVYVDGEMDARDMQDRLKAQMNAMRSEPEPGYLRIMTPDLLESGQTVPNLSTREGQDLLNKSINLGGEVDLIVLDHLSALFNTDDNDPNAWRDAQTYILALRKSGIAVLFLHHSGKGGAQRGTSKREDVLNVVLNLKRPSDYMETDGCRFDVVFEKHRGIYGSDVHEFEAKMEVRNNIAYWLTKSTKAQDRYEEAVELFQDGKSTSEVAEEVGVNKGTASRYKARAKREGLIDA